jgi:peptidylprolyl isomerase
VASLLALLAACGPAEPVEETETPTEAVDEEAVDSAEEAEQEEVAPADTPVGEELDLDTLEEAPASEMPEGPPEGFAGLDYSTTDSGLQYTVTEQGEGEQPVEGDVVRVHYEGQLADGTVFDSSFQRGDPFRFALGRGQVIPGWDEGIALLQEGGTAKLIIPPDLAYGPQGSGGVIPPDATLYFEVQLVEVLEGGPDEPVAVADDEYETTDDGLQYYVIEEGSGEMPEEGDPVRIEFTAWLDDGTRLDSSIDRGEPLVFVIGSEQIFPGLSEGVGMMEVGGQWQFVIPPDLAFGEEGAGAIPPDTSLVFLVDLLEILPQGPAEPTDVDEDQYEETESGLQYYDLEEGSGAEVEAGQQVTVRYTGWLAEDGTKFDSSYDRGRTFTFIPGSGQVIPGWEEGVIGMQEGGVRQLLIPPDLAYGEQGAGNVIPPDATLIFEVELVEIGGGAE